MSSLFGDLRYALRTLLKHPSFAAIVVVTLALSIGACCLIFSVVNGALLKPLPYKEPNALVLVWEINAQEGGATTPTSPANYRDWRDQNQVFTALAALRRSNFDLTGIDSPERVPGAKVAGAFFPVLGVQPIIGRSLGSEDESHRVVVVSEPFWRRHLGATTELQNRDLTLNGARYSVIGVMPESFRTPRDADLWVPLSFSPQEAAERSGRSLAVYARLRRGVTLDQAQAAMTTVARRMAAQYPASDQGWDVRLVPIHDQWLGGAAPSILILQGAVLLVLLIACANIANLLLARSQARRGEFALRTALGASRGRIARQMLAESVLLTLIGGGVGLFLAQNALKLLPQVGGQGLPWLDSVSIDPAVVAFAFLVSIVAGVLVGLVPVLQLSRTEIRDFLGESGARNAAGLQRQPLRRLLVICEIALALLLMIGAGLLLQSYRLLQSVNAGFEPQNLLTLRVVLPESRYQEPRQWTAFYTQVLERAAALPGVRSVAAGTTVPFTGVELAYDFIVKGTSLAAGQEKPSAHWNAVSADYFRTLGIRLVKGRVFSSHDDAKAPPVVIVDEALVRRYLGGGEPLGKVLQIGSKSQPREVVGVVGSVHGAGLESEAPPVMYVPYVQDPWEFTTFVARTAAEPERLGPSLAAVVRSIDGDQPVFNVKSMRQLLSDSLSQRRFDTVLLAGFAGLALLLALVGVYGLISYVVSQSTREISVRIALGAPRGEVLRLMLVQIGKLVLAGVVVGMLGALALTRVLTHLLYGVSSTDPAAFATLALLLALVAMTAGYLPARRALRVEPAAALRSG